MLATSILVILSACRDKASETAPEKTSIVASAAPSSAPSALALLVDPLAIYKNMSEADLDAIIAYLCTVPPVKNDITTLNNQFQLGG